MQLSLNLFFLLFFLLFPSSECNVPNQGRLYIRTSQVGFLPNDIKTGVIFSGNKIDAEKYYVINSITQKIEFEDHLPDTTYSYGKFKFAKTLDFTSLKKKGSYYIEIEGNMSIPFKIKEKLFNNITDSLLYFFQVQRCGPTNPVLHQPCHLSDVAKLIGYIDSSGIDLTGGWHDAGDYIKFLPTTSLTTYLMLFAYEFDPQKFGFDNNKNGVPDILEEAKVGLDWMKRSNFRKDKLVTQVQDLTDHNVGWRLPENDTLQYDRKGYVGIGKNQIGLYSATMAIAYRIWKNKFKDFDFADDCLKRAKYLYSVKNSVPNVDSMESGFYQDSRYLGKLALGAIELFISTKDSSYLKDAETFADSTGSDYWWSWGDINSLADYKIATIVPKYSEYLKNNLIQFTNNSKGSVFGEGMQYSWGTTNSFLGISLQSILYKKLTKDNSFDSLAVIHRDFILGRNPWGISFIYNIGRVYPKHLHSQIAYFNDGYLPGALSAGPAPLSILNNYKIKRESITYNYFNSDSVKYYDDKLDYISNEPTIIGNATALFVFGYYR